MVAFFENLSAINALLKLLLYHFDVLCGVACLQHEGIDSVGLFAKVVVRFNSSLF